HPRDNVAGALSEYLDAIYSAALAIDYARFTAAAAAAVRGGPAALRSVAARLSSNSRAARRVPACRSRQHSLFGCPVCQPPAARRGWRRIMVEQIMEPD